MKLTCIVDSMVSTVAHHSFPTFSFSCSFTRSWQLLQNWQYTSWVNLVSWFWLLYTTLTVYIICSWQGAHFISRRKGYIQSTTASLWQSVVTWSCMYFSGGILHWAPEGRKWLRRCNSNRYNWRTCSGFGMARERWQWRWRWSISDHWSSISWWHQWSRISWSQHG